MRSDRGGRRHLTYRRYLLRPAVIPLAVLALVAGFTPAPTAAQHPPPISSYNPESFTQELQKVRAGLDRAGNSPEALRAYRESLPKSWAVDVNGRRFDVPTDALSSRLDDAAKIPAQRDEKIKEARNYLDALSAEASSLSGERAPAAEADSARPKLQAILARPEYAHVRQQSWYEKLRQRFYDLLFKALLRFFRGVGGEARLGYILLWIALAAALILVAYLIFRNWFRSARSSEMALGAVAVPALSWQEWMFAAREAADRGDYRMAIHCAYWAGIARLQNAGALAPDRTKTPREFLRALSKSTLVIPEGVTARNQALAGLTSRLEKTWYGYHAATEADFQDSLAKLETLGCRLP